MRRRLYTGVREMIFPFNLLAWVYKWFERIVITLILLPIAFVIIVAIWYETYLLYVKPLFDK